MTETPVSHLLESSLYVADLAVSKDFYRKLFGFDVLFEDHRMCAMRVPASAVLLLFKLDGSLEPSQMPGGTIPPHGSHGEQHLCFAIPLASLDAWTKRLGTLGIPLESRVRQSFGGISLYFRDPDHHSLEVATPGLWANY